MLDIYNDKDLGICGGFSFYGDDVTLYVKPSTGEILYWDDLNGSKKIIDNLILKDAMTVINEELVFNNLLSNKYGKDAIGIIFCNHYVMVINSMVTAQKRSLDNFLPETDEMILIDLQLDIW